MEIQDKAARQLFTRIIAKRKDYIISNLKKHYPEKSERLERLLSEALQPCYLEGLVKTMKEPVQSENDEICS